MAGKTVSYRIVSPAADAVARDFLISKKFMNGGTMDTFIRAKTNDTKKVIKMLEAAKKPLIFTGKLRLFDITGSSNDLLKWQAAFSRAVDQREVDYLKPFGSWTKAFPTLSACCSKIPVKIEVAFSNKTDDIVFDNLAFDKLVQWDFKRHPSVPIGRMDLAPFYILGNVYGLRGIKVTSHPTTAVAKCGGLESSNAFVFALHWIGSVLSGTGNNIAELFSRSVIDANYTLGDNTGGQGISAMIEGGYHTFHYLIGNGMVGYFSHEVVSKSCYQNIYEHIDLVQPGRDFGAKLERTDTEINDPWCAALETPEGFNQQSRIPALAVDFAKALHYAAAGNENAWKEAVKLANAQVDIRVNRGPKYLHGNEEFVKTVRKMGGAAFALGAGGPGAMFAVLGPKGLTEDVRARFGLVPITEEVAQAVLKNNGKLKGYFPYEIDAKGMEYSGFEEAGFGITPLSPLEVVLNDGKR